MCAIQIIESIMGSTRLMVDSCDNISSLRRALIQPESVTWKWKQEDPISHMSDVYHSIDSGMQLVHVYGHHNIGKPASTLTTVSSLNVLLDALAEFIMTSFLSSSAPRTTIAAGFSDPYRLPIVSTSRVPVNSNISQATIYEIFKHHLLQYWANR